jgi:hypothetical protein
MEKFVLRGAVPIILKEFYNAARSDDPALKKFPRLPVWVSAAIRDGDHGAAFGDTSVGVCKCL